MKRTIEEEKKKILSMMSHLDESIGLSILGGMHNMAIEHIKAVKESIASGLSDDDFRKLIMNAVEVVLTGSQNEIGSDVNAVDGEPTDDIV